MGKTFRWLTTREAADRACCEPKAIRRAARSGRLRAARVAHGEFRFLEPWIDEWLINQLMPEDHGIDVAIDVCPRERHGGEHWEIRHGAWT